MESEGHVGFNVIAGCITILKLLWCRLNVVRAALPTVVVTLAPTVPVLLLTCHRDRIETGNMVSKLAVLLEVICHALR